MDGLIPDNPPNNPNGISSQQTQVISTASNVDNNASQGPAHPPLQSFTHPSLGRTSLQPTPSGSPSTPTPPPPPPPYQNPQSQSHGQPSNVGPSQPHPISTPQLQPQSATGPTLFRCRKCKVTKPISEAHLLARQTPYGNVGDPSNTCSSCWAKSAAYAREYNRRKREERLGEQMEEVVHTRNDTPNSQGEADEEWDDSMSVYEGNGILPRLDGEHSQNGKQRQPSFSQHKPQPTPIQNSYSHTPPQHQQQQANNSQPSFHTRLPPPSPKWGRAPPAPYSHSTETKLRVLVFDSHPPRRKQDYETEQGRLLGLIEFFFRLTIPSDQVRVCSVGSGNGIEIFGEQAAESLLQHLDQDIIAKFDRDHGLVFAVLGRSI